MRNHLTITLDNAQYAIVKRYAEQWQCTKATAVRTLMLDGVKANDANTLKRDCNSI